MREYLFELRKKINKTQKDITKLLLEKYNINLSYSTIERGVQWSNITERRAQVLADVLESTPEYILECDAKYGGYEGKNFRSGRNNPFQVMHGRRTEYDEPLTDEEKELAEKYAPYAEKMINIFRFKEYRGVLESGLMSYEDFYDIGMVAFLRSVKEITVKRSEKSWLFEALVEPDYFYRFSFSRAIKHSYYKYVRAELAGIRKDYHNAYSMDETFNTNDGDGSERYNFVPSKDLPIPIMAESTWSLSNLYSHLTDKQISACKLLINGWTSKEIIDRGYASKRDIGTIRFYLNQVRSYGKILWDADEYKNVEENINYNFCSNKWEIKLSYKGKHYQLGAYTDINIALDVRNLACYHINKDDFLPWFSAHLMSNIRFGQEQAEFIYPLENYEEIDLDTIGNIQERVKCKSTIRAASKEKPIGIRKCGKDSYSVMFQKYNLGVYRGFDKALEMRKLAEFHMSTGDMAEWYAKVKLEKEKEKITYTRIEPKKLARGISYAVVRGYKQIYTYLGLYSKDKAEAVKLLADSHIDAGDYDNWAKTFYSDYKKRLSLINGNIEKMDDNDFYSWLAGYKVNSSNTVEACDQNNSVSNFIALYALSKYIANTARCYKILCYDTFGAEHLVYETSDVEEAYKTMDLANAHIEAGDFDVWIADYKKS